MNKSHYFVFLGMFFIVSMSTNCKDNDEIINLDDQETDTLNCLIDFVEINDDLVQSYFYDTENKIIERIELVHEDTFLVDRIDYKYDSNNNIIEDEHRTYLHGIGIMSHDKNLIFYNTNDEITSSFSYRDVTPGTGQFELTNINNYIYEYLDDTIKIIKESNNIITSSIDTIIQEHLLDNNYNLLKRTLYRNGMLESTELFEYDNKYNPHKTPENYFKVGKNNIIKETRYFENDTVILTREYFYEYNELGFPTQQSFLKQNGEEVLFKYNYDCE